MAKDVFEEWQTVQGSRSVYVGSEAREAGMEKLLGVREKEAVGVQGKEFGLV